LSSPEQTLAKAVQTALSKLDHAVGEAFERIVVRHHRRRLARIGRLGALDSPPGGFAAGDPRPQKGNRFEILIDGATALPLIADEIENAESHVHLAGWFFSPEFSLRPGGPGLRDFLAAAARQVDVRVLSWAGSPLPLFRPDRKDVREMRDELTRESRVVCALDDLERPMHCHHEKLVIVDDRVAFVGGIDLTDYSGQRFDWQEHPPRDEHGWHDAAARVEGPAVFDVAEHFRLRWQEVTAEALPAANRQPAAGDVEVQVVRTIPELIYSGLPRGDFRILETYQRALRSAERFIYLENQFLWSPEIVATLAEKLRHPPCDDFRMLILLPAKPSSGNDDTRGQLGLLVRADGGAGRILACTIYQHGSDEPRPVYVHAKIGIVDDRWLTIGSANLNEHSLFNDTEMNLVVEDERIARDVRLRLWAEHLGRPVDDFLVEPAVAFDRFWRPVAEEQLRRRERGAVPTHHLIQLPHVSRRSWGLLGPLSGLLIDG
jgi:phosphatidylserine/phosphatidylglycerophosphate/cardiolipin synthase-like enzyme